MKRTVFILSVFYVILTLVGCGVSTMEKPEQPTGEEKQPLQVYQENSCVETFDSAVQSYRQQMDAEPDNFRPRLMLSWMLLMELERNNEYFATNIDSLPTPAKFQYANMLLELGRNEEAIGIYKMLNEASPNWSCPWRHRGEANMKIGDYAEAEKVLLKAIETRKEHYDAYVWLAEAQKELGKTAEALATLETGLTYKGKDIEDPEEESNSLDVSFLHLELLKANGKTEAYDEMAEKVRKIAPDDERWNDLK